MKQTLKALLLAAGMTLSATSGAAVINGSIGTFDADGDGRVDDSKISRVLFNVSAGTTVFFDSLVWESTGVDLNGDGKLTGFDNYMMLLKGNTVLQSNDDSRGTFKDGSVHHYDSTIEHKFAEAGTYMITLGQLSYNSLSALQGYEKDRTFWSYTSSLEKSAAWRLTMTATGGRISNVREVGVNEVPEPASLALLGLGLFGIAARRKLGKGAQG